MECRRTFGEPYLWTLWLGGAAASTRAQETWKQTVNVHYDKTRYSGQRPVAFFFFWLSDNENTEDAGAADPVEKNKLPVKLWEGEDFF